MDCERPILRKTEAELTTIDGRPVKVVQRVLTYAEVCEAKELSGFQPGHWDAIKLRAWLKARGKEGIGDLTADEIAELYSSECFAQGDDLNTAAGRRMFLLQVAYSMGMRQDKGMGEGWSLEDKVTVEALTETFTESDILVLIGNISKLKALEAQELKN